MITCLGRWGNVLVDPGEFADALAQALIERNATESKPLKIGNVEFWRADDATCYDLARIHWRADDILSDFVKLLEKGKP